MKFLLVLIFSLSSFSHDFPFYYWSQRSEVNGVLSANEPAFIFSNNQYFCAFFQYILSDRHGPRPLKIHGFEANSLQPTTEQDFPELGSGKQLQFFEWQNQLYLAILSSQGRLSFLKANVDGRWERDESFQVHDHIHFFSITPRDSSLYFFYSQQQTPSRYALKVGDGRNWESQYSFSQMVTKVPPAISWAKNGSPQFYFVDETDQSLNKAQLKNDGTLALSSIFKLNPSQQIVKSSPQVLPLDNQDLVGLKNEIGSGLDFYFIGSSGYEQALFLPMISNVMHFSLLPHKGDHKQWLLMTLKNDGRLHKAVYDEALVLRYGILYRIFQNWWFGFQPKAMSSSQQ